jgi:hypothetical protein
METILILESLERPEGSGIADAAEAVLKENPRALIILESAELQLLLQQLFRVWSNG